MKSSLFLSSILMKTSFMTALLIVLSASIPSLPVLAKDKDKDKDQKYWNVTPHRDGKGAEVEGAYTRRSGNNSYQIRGNSTVRRGHSLQPRVGASYGRSFSKNKNELNTSIDRHRDGKGADIGASYTRRSGNNSYKIRGGTTVRQGSPPQNDVSVSFGRSF